MKKMRWTLKVAAVGIAVAVLAVGWWLGSPLFIDKEVNEAAPKSDSPLTMQSKESAKPEAEMMKTKEAYMGSFVDGEPGHHAKGKAVTLVDGATTILRLEELDATNGPDLYLFLAKPGSKTSEGINLGKLKGNLGNQNYELPTDVDLTIYNKVVIYCKQFSVDFGYAELQKT